MPVNSTTWTIAHKLVQQDSENIPVNPPFTQVFKRACLGGLIVFMVLFGISSWKEQANLQVAHISTRFAIHVALSALVIAIFSRKRTWSLLKMTISILVLSLGLLGITGIKTFTDSASHAEMLEQRLDRFCQEVNLLTTRIEMVIEQGGNDQISVQLEPVITQINGIVQEIEQVPDSLDWHLIPIKQKFLPILNRTAARFSTSMELLFRSGKQVELKQSLEDVRNAIDSYAQWSDMTRRH